MFSQLVIILCNPELSCQQQGGLLAVTPNDTTFIVYGILTYCHQPHRWKISHDPLDHDGLLTGLSTGRWKDLIASSSDHDQWASAGDYKRGAFLKCSEWLMFLQSPDLYAKLGVKGGKIHFSLMNGGSSIHHLRILSIVQLSQLMGKNKTQPASLSFRGFLS